MKLRSFILLLLLLSIAKPAEFMIVSDIKELPGDKTAETYPFKDVNGDPCAVIKLEVDIEGIQFKSMGFEKSDIRDGNYLIYMQGGSRNLTLIKEGFIAKTYPFPTALRPNLVYGMKIKGIYDEKKYEDIVINIQTDPKFASVFLDDQPVEKTDQIRTSVGKHEVKLEYEGYQTLLKTINVTKDSTYFDLKLEKTKLMSLMIKTDPVDAEVYIDNMYTGRTNKYDKVKTYFSSGKYPVQIVLPGYAVKDTIIEVPGSYPDSEKNKSYKWINYEFRLIVSDRDRDHYLLKNYAEKDSNAVLNIEVPEKTAVRMRDKLVEERKNIKTFPQVCPVKIQVPGAEEYRDILYIRPNETKTFKYFPDVPCGTVQIAVIPKDSDVLLKGNYKTADYESNGSKIFENIPEGIYGVRISKPGYYDEFDNVNVTEGALIREAYKLKERGSVHSPDMVLIQKNDKTDGFYINRFETTRGFYKAVTGKYPEGNDKHSDEMPAQVTWYDAVEFCNLLSEKEGLEKCYSGTGDDIECNFDNDGYRLQTTFEWEQTVSNRFMDKIDLYKDSLGNKPEVAKKIYPVGSKHPNRYGLYDMLTNALEWTWDCYRELDRDLKIVPGGKTDCTKRMVRGDDEIDGTAFMRAVIQSRGEPMNPKWKYGFRIARKAQ